MKSFLFVSVIIILGLSCNRKQEAKQSVLPNSFQFDSYSKVYVKYTNAADTNFAILAHGWNIFAENDKSTSFHRIGKNLLFDSILTIYPHPVDLNIVWGNRFFGICKLGNIFLIPGDSLFIEIDLADSANFKRSMKFSGNAALLCEYYNQKDLHFNTTDFNGPKAMACNFATTYIEYRKIEDTLVAKEFAFFNQYIKKHELPNWAIQYELNDLKYNSAFGILNSTLYRQKMLFLDEELFDGCYDFLDTINIYEPKAIFGSYYYTFLREYKSALYKLPETLYVNRNFENRYEYEFYSDVCFADSFLEGEIKDIYLCSRWFSLAQRRNVESQIQSYIQYIKTPKYADFLTNYIETKYRLNEGDKAPSFYLKDSTGNAYSLRSFKGKFIYLFFWNSGCKPCLKVLERLNSFIDEFKNEDIVVVTINSDTKEEVWKYILKKYNPKSINLWSKGNWPNILGDSYDIHSHPHFCLIDKNGLVIMNKCERPGAGIKELIRMELEAAQHD